MSLSAINLAGEIFDVCHLSLAYFLKSKIVESWRNFFGINGTVHLHIVLQRAALKR
jgi:hypothetical protein